MQFLAFLFGWWVYRPYSRLVAFVMRAKGIKVGRNFYIQGVPYLKIQGRPQDIQIGSDVSIMGGVDIRNREQGRVIIGDGVKLDTSCRLIAANNAVLEIGPGCRIGAYTIINCGEDITIGGDTMMAGFCYIQSSNHGTRKGILIKDQPHTYGKISIGRDVWLGGHVTVLASVTIGDGAIVGAKSVVTKDLPENSICAGIPAKMVKVRE
ncbi:MAG: acyltransferase [Alphaproteobacteria bacterium]|nr:acyltransferase [Alphaproteobacteria bacterium]